MEAGAAGVGTRGDAPLAVRRGGSDQPLQLPLNLVAHKLGPRSPPATPPCLSPPARLDLVDQAGRDPARRRASRGLAERRLRLRCRGSGTRSSKTTRSGRSPSPGRRRSAGGSARRLPQEGQPRARLDCAADRPRGRRLGDRRRQGEAPRLLACGPELHLGPADPRSPEGRREVHRPLRQERRAARHRRSDGREHRRRPTDQPQGPRPGEGVGRRGPRRPARSSPAGNSSTRTDAWRRP